MSLVEFHSIGATRRVVKKFSPGQRVGLSNEVDGERVMEVKSHILVDATETYRYRRPESKQDSEWVVSGYFLDTIREDPDHIPGATLTLWRRFLAWCRRRRYPTHLPQAVLVAPRKEAP